jgi:broad specificity phosphatase PhoE
VGQVPTSTSPQPNDGEGRSPTRVYLARHGRTPLNAAGVLRGHLDPPLDEVGREQADRLASVLADRRVAVVVASPLRRASETADAVAFLVGKIVQNDPRLVDRDYGRWAGQPGEAVEARWGSLDNAPGVEPVDDVRSRAWEALNDLIAMTPNGAAVAVSHDAVIRILLIALAPELGDPDSLAQETGCFNTLEHVGGRWKVLRVNEIPGEPQSPTEETRGENRGAQTYE